ncbi:hypothetical protein [Sediminicoccus rosea]|uniref:Uncharacterized protein n=1 Tax=Sediminicoccus rosea TaxID=1225128 RepID=A0ABZ0PJF6_9PROT|nr:hypothetical protein [Sediminicoccus rosea]WPB85401.1 hypothetical protein R9Z33_00675 [Sediminicoccus rosea]
MASQAWIVAALIISLASPASAQTRTIAQAGGWTAFGGTTERGTPTCGLDAQDANRTRHFLIQFYQGNRHLDVRLIRPHWAIPANTDIPVRIVIDGNAPWSATASGTNREVKWTIPTGPVMARFEAAFRRGNAMRVEFMTGTEPPWTFNLAGTNAIMEAFVTCLRALPAGSAPSQPFDGPRPSAPTQPFSNPPAPARPAPPPGKPLAPLTQT